jgi:hypothetical protein
VWIAYGTVLSLWLIWLISVLLLLYLAFRWKFVSQMSLVTRHSSLSNHLRVFPCPCQYQYPAELRSTAPSSAHSSIPLTSPPPTSSFPSRGFSPTYHRAARHWISRDPWVAWRCGSHGSGSGARIWRLMSWYGWGRHWARRRRSWVGGSRLGRSGWVGSPRSFSVLLDPSRFCSVLLGSARFCSVLLGSK